MLRAQRRYQESERGRLNLFCGTHHSLARSLRPASRSALSGIWTRKRSGRRLNEMEAVVRRDTLHPLRCKLTSSFSATHTGFRTMLLGVVCCSHVQIVVQAGRNWATGGWGRAITLWDSAPGGSGRDRCAGHGRDRVGHGHAVSQVQQASPRFGNSRTCLCLSAINSLRRHESDHEDRDAI